MTAETGKLVIDDKILLAAASLPSVGFTAEELVVATFQKFPDDFYLMGFPQYPDSNKVLTQITTAGRGLQKRGWLRKVGTKRYQLTGEGLRRLQALTVPNGMSAVRSDNRDVADLVLHWLKSEAFSKTSNGQWDAITEREALAFWGLTSGATAARTNHALAIAESAVRVLAEAISTARQFKIHHDRDVLPAEAQKLVDTHRGLKKKFSEALDYLQGQRR